MWMCVWFRWRRSSHYCPACTVCQREMSVAQGQTEDCHFPGVQGRYGVCFIVRSLFKDCYWSSLTLVHFIFLLTVCMFFYLVFYFIVITCVCQCVWIKTLDDDDDDDDAAVTDDFVTWLLNPSLLPLPLAINGSMYLGASVSKFITIVA